MIFTLKVGKWCPGAESNHRHEDFQSGAIQENTGTYAATTRQTPDETSNTYPTIVKPGFAYQPNKNPGALGGATGVNGIEEGTKLLKHASPEPATFATFFWCKASGSVERFDGYPSGVAI